MYSQYHVCIAVLLICRKVGDPFDPSSKQGPQINQSQLEKIQKYVETVSEGRSCGFGVMGVGRADCALLVCCFRDGDLFLEVGWGWIPWKWGR